MRIEKHCPTCNHENSEYFCDRCGMKEIKSEKKFLTCVTVHGIGFDGQRQYMICLDCEVWLNGVLCAFGKEVLAKK